MSWGIILVRLLNLEIDRRIITDVSATSRGVRRGFDPTMSSALYQASFFSKWRFYYHEEQNRQARSGRRMCT